MPRNLQNIRNLANKGWRYAKKRLRVEEFLQQTADYDARYVDDIDIVQTWNSAAEQKIFDEAYLGRARPRIESALGEPQLKRAARVLAGQAQLFWYHWLKVGSVPDYNLDPFEGFHWPVGLHSSRYFQFNDKQGDLKRVWELSRFTYLSPLLPVAARPENRELIQRHFEGWLRQNPYAYSTAWTCSQESSLRAVQWFFLSLYAEELQVSARVRAFFYLTAKKVASEIGYAMAQRNNHAITESVFLMLAAEMFSEPTLRQNWRRQAAEVLEHCLHDQFFDDGGYIQNSWTYHRFALQSLLLAHQIIRASGELGALCTLIESVFERSLSMFAEVVGQGGDVPNFGPNDGALLFNWGGWDYRDFRPLVVMLASALGQRVPIDVSGSVLQQTEIDLAVLDLEKPQIETRVRKTNVNFENLGLHIRRNQRWTVHMHAPQLGGRYPSQCDALHLNIFHDDRPLLIDSGSYEYFGREAGSENFLNLLSTRAHNTARIGALEQMKKGPRFVWWTSLDCDVEISDSQVTAEHSGFRAQNTDLRHCRSFWFEGNALVVEDRFTGADDVAIEIYWHFDPSWSLDSTTEGAFMLDQQLNVEFSGYDDLVKEQAYDSLYYAQRRLHPALTVRLSGSSILRTTFSER